MYYEINVSLNGRHLFATHERSITDKWELEKVYKIFRDKFPEEEGYKITITHWKKYGTQINMEEA